jgi:hypothetical protein
VVTSGQNLTFTTTNNEVTFTAPAGGVEQVIEGLNLESGTYVLNWEGTATATVGGTAVAKGGTVTVVGGTNTTVRFIGGTFIRPQFEAGSVATPFERRPYGVELELCERYYESGGTFNEPFFSGVVLTGNIYYFGHKFKTTKRTSPTVTLTVSANLGFPGGASSVNGLPTLGGFMTTKTANGNFNNAFYSDSWTASAEL